MDKLLAKIADLLVEHLGEKGVWVALILLIIFVLFVAYERFNKARATTHNNKHKRFELFVKVFGSDLEKQSPIVVEQAFSNYFGFELAYEEIEYCLNLTRPTECVHDVKSSRYLIKFNSQLSKYEETKGSALKVRKYVTSGTYWLFSLFGIYWLYQFLTTQNMDALVITILGLVLAGFSITFIKPTYSALRVTENHYVKRSKNLLIVLPK